MGAEEGDKTDHTLHVFLLTVLHIPSSYQPPAGGSYWSLVTSGHQWQLPVTSGHQWQLPVTNQ